MKNKIITKKRLKLAFILTVIGFSIIAFFCYKIYCFDDLISKDGKLVLSNTGLIGDFIGGFAGTIFSIVGVVLLFETLALQRIESSDSKDVFIKQQFENTFFELLKLHKENLASFKTFDILGNEKCGRKFFEHQKDFLQNVFTPTRSISKNRKLAVEIFQYTYIQHYDDFAIYFRTLYQLYSLIEKSKIEGVDQATYSKILRAQLSEGELFFIRYNAMTEYGSQSAKYINMFNILKHLSHFELLEFKDWWSKLNDFEKNGLGMIIREIKYIVREFLMDNSDHILEKRFMNNRYIIRIISNCKSQLCIEIEMDKQVSVKGADIVMGLDSFTYDEIENLFKCVLKEIIIYSNYNEYNIRRQLDFSSDNSNPNKIIIKVKNWMKIPLKIHYWYD
jgi:hypothetical protein